MAKRTYLLIGLCCLALVPLARGGVWGDRWNQFTWGPRLSDVPEGLNLYAPTSETETAVATCYDLLEYLGGAGAVESISAVVPDTQVSVSCGYQDAAPAGVDYPVALGSAYLVQLTQVAALSSGPPPSCPATTLAQGVNLVGVGKPLDGLSCFDVLTAFGVGTVAAVERLDEENRRFVSCALTDTGTNEGTDFPIVPGEGYAVHANTPSVTVNLNDTGHPVCTGPL